jgi:hypothetical protein
MEGFISDHGLQPLPKRRLYQQVASRVESLILTELKPGDRLPTWASVVGRCVMRFSAWRC